MQARTYFRKVKQLPLVMALFNTTIRNVFDDGLEVFVMFAMAIGIGVSIHLRFITAEIGSFLIITASICFFLQWLAEYLYFSVFND